MPFSALGASKKLGVSVHVLSRENGARMLDLPREEAESKKKGEDRAARVGMGDAIFWGWSAGLRGNAGFRRVP